MSMFDKYENLNTDYSPNNQKVYMPQPREKVEYKLPIELYNSNDEFIGYTWHYGDTFTLSLPVNKKVKVEEDAIIYEEAEKEPTTETEGTYGQKCYNTVDFKLWTCKTLDQTVYKWEEESAFTVPKNGSQEITLQVFSDVIGKTVVVELLNFRGESIKEFTINASDPFQININEEVAKLLVKGIYLMTVTVVSDDSDKRFDYEYTILIK